jgi:phospholipid/cholesterol/gamma-HCH transport system substrate-binding protein
MLSTLDASNKNLLAITTNLKEISTKILSGKGAISVLLNDSTLPENITHTVVDLRSAISYLKTTSVLSENAIQNFNEFSSKLNKQGTLVNDLVTDTIVFSDLRNSMSQLTSTMNNITRFSENIKNASNTLNQQSNTAGAILYDEQMAAHLKDMIKNLDSASHKLDEDLQAVQHSFLLRGYFRKKAKTK